MWQRGAEMADGAGFNLTAFVSLGFSSDATWTPTTPIQLVRSTPWLAITRPYSLLTFGSDCDLHPIILSSDTMRSIRQEEVRRSYSPPHVLLIRAFDAWTVTRGC